MVAGEFEGIQIFGGASSVELAQDVAMELGIPAIMPSDEFSNGEVGCTLPESIRGKDVYVIESHSRYQRLAPYSRHEIMPRSPQDALVDQMTIVNAASSSWAGRVIAVSPLAGYGRQDRRTGRQSITAALAFRMLRMAGADGLMSIDMHSPQAEGFFNGPFEHLTATQPLADFVNQEFEGQEFVVVSPDNGRYKASGRFRNLLGERAGLAVVDDKERQRDGSVRASRLLGSLVKDMPCVLLDDMIDGAGTITAAAEIACEGGASYIMAVATHGIFSGEAADRLANSPIDKVVVTDTVALPPEIANLAHPHIEVVSIARFLAMAIKSVHEGTSVEALHAGLQQRI